MNSETSSALNANSIMLAERPFDTFVGKFGSREFTFRAMEVAAVVLVLLSRRSNNGSFEGLSAKDCIVLSFDYKDVIQPMDVFNGIIYLEGEQYLQRFDEGNDTKLIIYDKLLNVLEQ